MDYDPAGEFSTTIAPKRTATPAQFVALWVLLGLGVVDLALMALRLFTPWTVGPLAAAWVMAVFLAGGLERRGWAIACLAFPPVIPVFALLMIVEAHKAGPEARQREQLRLDSTEAHPQYSPGSLGGLGPARDASRGTSGTVSMKSSVKGWLGEKATTAGLWLHLDESIYRRIDNVIVPSRSGTTQIDHVLVSVFGIFVLETKNIKGWIYGAPEQPKWTQVLYGKKCQFGNPLKQNYRHTKCLSEYLDLDHDLFHSVVFFIGECEFKTPMPENVLTRGLSRYIEGFAEHLLTYEQVQRVSQALRTLKDSGGLSKRDHLDSLRERHGCSTQCPRCGGSLVQRTAKQGSFAGQSFLGCSNYPRCRYTKGL